MTSPHLSARALGAMLAITVIFAACGDGDRSNADTTGSSLATDVTTTPKEGTMPSRTDRTPASLPDRAPTSERIPVTGEVPRDLLDPVIEDAAARAGVDVAAVEVITGQEMVWSDGALGCADPGQAYTQAPVSGYWVVLEVESVAFDYRLDGVGSFKLCTSPFPGTGGTSPSS